MRHEGAGQYYFPIVFLCTDETKMQREHLLKIPFSFHSILSPINDHFVKI